MKGTLFWGEFEGGSNGKPTSSSRDTALDGTCLHVPVAISSLDTARHPLIPETTSNYCRMHPPAQTETEHDGLTKAKYVVVVLPTIQRIQLSVIFDVPMLGIYD